MSTRKRKPRKPQLPSLRPAEFFASHPIFRYETFAKAVPGSRASHARALHYHQQKGRLLKLRRGLYATTRMGDWIDPCELAVQLVPHGIVAYDTALMRHGVYLLKPSKVIKVLSLERIRDFSFKSIVYRSIRPAKSLLELPLWGDGVEIDRGVHVCTVSRAFVDCLDRLDLAPGLDELWDAFVQRDDLDAHYMVAHALALKNRVTAARVGLFLQCHPGLGRQGAPLDSLEANSPRHAALMDPARWPVRNCDYFPRWRLWVPSALLERMTRHRGRAAPR